MHYFDTLFCPACCTARRASFFFMGIVFMDARSTLPGVLAATFPTGFRGGLPGMTWLGASGEHALGTEDRKSVV